MHDRLPAHAWALPATACLPLPFVRLDVPHPAPILKPALPRGAAIVLPGWPATQEEEDVHDLFGGADDALGLFDSDGSDDDGDVGVGPAPGTKGGSGDAEDAAGEEGGKQKKKRRKGEAAAEGGGAEAAEAGAARATFKAIKKKLKVRLTCMCAI